MSIIIYLFTLFLVVIGLCDVIHSIRLCFFDVKHRKSKVICCVLKDKYADLQLQYVIEQYKWYGRRYADRIVAINCLDDDLIYERCAKIANGNDVSIINENDLIKILSTEN